MPASSARLAGVELVGIYDAAPASRPRRWRESTARGSATSLDELADQIDAAVVAVPTVAPRRGRLRPARRGLHVLVEKPIAATPRRGGRAARGARRGGWPRAGGGPRRVLQPGGAGAARRRAAAALRRGRAARRLLAAQPRRRRDPRPDDPRPADPARARSEPGRRGAGHRHRRARRPRVDIANARIALASGCVANVTASRVSAERVRKLRAFLPRPLLLARLPGAGDQGLPARGRAAARRRSCPATCRWRRPSRCAASSRPSWPPAAASAARWSTARRAALATALGSHGAGGAGEAIRGAAAYDSTVLRRSQEKGSDGRQFASV